MHTKLGFDTKYLTRNKTKNKSDQIASSTSNTGPVWAKILSFDQKTFSFKNVSFHCF